MLHLVVVLSAFINLTGAVLYVRAMLRGKAKPNRTTWFLWALAPLIAFFAAFSEGATWSTVSILMSGLTPLVVLVASYLIPGAYWKFSKLDFVCGLLSIFALVFWFLTQDPFYAVVFAILADALAGVPTLIKAWKHPASEADATFWGGFISSGVALLVVSQWVFVEYGFPLYLNILCLTFILVIRLRRHFLKRRQ